MNELEAITKFNNTALKDHLRREREAIEKRNEFVDKYPIESIHNLSLDEYFYYCYELRRKLKVVSSMGDIYPSTFGIYKVESENQIKLSVTYEKLFENNYETAFRTIKEDILSLLNAGAKKDYDFIRSSRLNSSFIYKLLNIYFPELYFPVGTRDTLITYCSIIGIDVNYKTVDMISDADKLRKWRDSFIESSDWTDHTLMGFFVWMIKTKQTISGKSESTVSKRIMEVERIEQELSEANVEGKERLALVKLRVNQGDFRKELLKKYKTCNLCSISNKQLLIASHIKPWAEAEALEKLDPDNGLLLCANHDKLFDCGLISFDENGLVMISDELSDNDIKATSIGIQRIEMSKDKCEYMEYHRNNIFRDCKK